MPAKTLEKTMDIDDILLKKARRKDLLMAVLPFVGLIVTILALTIATKGVLLSGTNIMNIMNQCFTLALMGIGASFVYARGGMDFSIGPAGGVAQLVCFALVTKAGVPLIVGALAAICIAVTCTMIVGVGSDSMHLQPFVVSLCVRNACTGILIVGCNALGRNIQVPLATFGALNNNVVKVVILLLVVAVGWYLFEKTSLGKQEKAIGGNITTARQSGIRVRKNVALSHLLLGICVGIAASFQMARAGTVSAQSGSGMEFNMMIALALGGFPMAGGSSAKIRSTIIGALTITILTNGLTIAGVDNAYINLIKGILFIVIVTLSYDRSNLKQVVFM